MRSLCPRRSREQSHERKPRREQCTAGHMDELATRHACVRATLRLRGVVTFRWRDDTGDIIETDQNWEVVDRGVHWGDLDSCFRGHQRGSSWLHFAALTVRKTLFTAFALLTGNESIGCPRSSVDTNHGTAWIPDRLSAAGSAIKRNRSLRRISG